MRILIHPKRLFCIDRDEIFNAQRNGHNIYERDDLCTAFSWFSHSRGLYGKLRDTLHLHSTKLSQKLLP